MEEKTDATSTNKELKKYSGKLRLVKYPTKSLLKKSVPVEKIDDAIKAFAKDLVLFIYTGGLPWGVPTGLAAPQVGKNIRLFIAFEDLFINPEITWITKAPKNPVREGCYSLEENNFSYPVERAQSIRMKWQDIDGEWHEERFNGFTAQILQHELDHLDGVLINSYSK